jgi:tetratricopeptide (TPR) repeat protein
MELKPDAAVSATMAQALRSQGKTIAALQFAREATELDPSDSTTWLELGDSYSTLRGHGAEARRAYAEGARVQRETWNLQAALNIMPSPWPRITSTPENCFIFETGRSAALYRSTYYFEMRNRQPPSRHC